MILLLTILTLAFFVKKGDDLATILKKVATGILMFFVPIIIYILIAGLVHYIKER